MFSTFVLADLCEDGSNLKSNFTETNCLNGNLRNIF